jgi:hypothetical protein
MKFACDIPMMVLRALARKHPSHARLDATVLLEAAADRVQFEANGASAFVPAQIAVAGSGLAPRDGMTRFLATHTKGRPITIEAKDGMLRIDWLRIPVLQITTNASYRFEAVPSASG